MAGRWADAAVVQGFSTAAANQVLLAFARAELAGRPGMRILDLGCGAARNAVPLAAARKRVGAAGLGRRVVLVRAPMDRLPLRDASVDLVVAHGIWNLARSAAEFRRAIAEAARVARSGAGLFLFTFSRETLAPGDLRCGFEKDPPGPLTEYNRPVAGPAFTRGGPVIYEGTFRRR